MKKQLLFTVLISIVLSCNTKKQVESAISTGNYDQAITNALQKLRNNKNKKRKFLFGIGIYEFAYLMRPHVCSFQGVAPHRFGVVDWVEVGVCVHVTLVREKVVDADAVGPSIHRKVKKRPLEWIWNPHVPSGSFRMM